MALRHWRIPSLQFRLQDGWPFYFRFNWNMRIGRLVGHTRYKKEALYGTSQ